MSIRPTMRRAVLAASLPALIAGLGSVSTLAQAQAWPTRTLRFIVPFAPGGGNDTVARAIAAQISGPLGQQVVVDNRPGAGGVIGAEAAARAPANGYTLFLGGVGSHAVNPSLMPNLPYDAVKDFAPVSLIASAPSVVVVANSVNVRNIAELTALLKANPGKYNYATNGNGSSSHLATLLYESLAGVKMVHVPYKGFAPALTDILGGQIQVMFNSIVALVPQIKAGKVRALAVSSRSRSPLMPDLPTLAEAGVTGYEAGSWYGILVPAATPRLVVQLLNAEVVRAVKTAEVRERLAGEGAEPIGSTPEEFAAHIKAEMTRLGKVIREANLKAE
jgi:tripartite-type tricarboxylate transporter receptor subunit TctC